METKQKLYQEENKETILKQRKDYYNENMKYITYFDSIDELNEIVTNIDVIDISLKMKKYNETRTLNILQQWKKIIDTTLAPPLVLL